MNLKFNSTTCNSNKKWNKTNIVGMQHVIQIKNGTVVNVNGSVKIIARAKQNYSWKPSMWILRAESI